jgi:hypothetical protein
MKNHHRHLNSFNTKDHHNFKSLGKFKSLSVRLIEEMLDDLRYLADKDNRSLANYVRIVLADHIEEAKRQDR